MSLGRCDVRDCPNEATAIVGLHYVCLDHASPPGPGEPLSGPRFMAQPARGPRGHDQD